MRDNRIDVTEHDATRLRIMIGALAARRGTERRTLEPLRRELDRADIVPPALVDPRVVTMHSRVRLRDEGSGEARVYTLVNPEFADLDSGHLSVLAPIGTAILGYREGDIIAWDVPAGTRRFRIEKVLYQPEAAGQEHLKYVLPRAENPQQISEELEEGERRRPQATG